MALPAGQGSRTKLDQLIGFRLFLFENAVHDGGMTKLLEQAVERVRTLPSDQQDELARMLLRLADAQEEPVSLSAEERAAIAESKAAAARGDFATDDEVRAVWASYGL
ncbi:hypothetical protein [Pararhizobium sp. O133]|uniref:hypothetical protein n=1 Tax=Pararhizobium sp. O133 TaxID=3449278 RepID=UPI003F6895F6